MNHHSCGLSPLRILLIGPLPPPIGGTRVSFRILVDALARRPDVEIRVISLPPARRNTLRAVGHFTSQIVRMLRHAPRSDVIALHCGVSAIPVRAPATSMVSRMFGKPLIIRTFGGEELRNDSGYPRCDRILTALGKADLYLGQTQEQVQQARSQRIARVEWFPTSRSMLPMNDNPTEPERPCRRFVFVSHVKETKGIRELIAAGERFGDDVSVDVYGPFREGMTKDVFAGCQVVRYRGVIPLDKVMEVLREHDALLLPTYHSGEGYPGIIIEAYAAGLPVICTRWRRLTEIVDHSCGILIEPRDAEALYDAMNSLLNDPQLYARLRRGVLEKQKLFDAEVWVERFVQYCRDLARNSKATG